jgi:hypothetical protein
MDAQTRKYLKSLSKFAAEAEEKGFDEIAEAIRKFRDSVVNVMLGEGISLDRIERAAYRALKGKPLE